VRRDRHEEPSFSLPTTNNSSCHRSKKDFRIAMKNAYARQQDEALQNEDVPDYITTCFRLHLTPAAPLQTLKTPTNNNKNGGTTGKLVWQKGQLIGKGGFGKVYKGEVERGEKREASKQGH
jgi:hypothetical protein